MQIVGLLLLNATISFVEESNADKAIKALAGALAPKCKVNRVCLWEGTRLLLVQQADSFACFTNSHTPASPYVEPCAYTHVHVLQALRDGKVKSMDAVDIVPGDVLIVRLGDIVPADIKILGDEGSKDEQVPLQVSLLNACWTDCQPGKHHYCAAFARGVHSGVLRKS